jgi:hypothetical protein
MLPPFDQGSGNLPPGQHEATWEEFAERYGWTTHRKVLLVGLRAALDALQNAGCPRVFIDGSFVTAKDNPGDFDACWEWDEQMNLDVLDPVLLDFTDLRARQKATYGGELFPADAWADAEGTTFREFFQRDKGTDAAKGIVRINLQERP